MRWIERLRGFPVLRRFHLFGVAGSILMLACVVAPMVAYTGKAGERYSPLNHFISELGEVGVSRLAGVFNIGLVTSGALYLPFALGLGVTLGGFWAAAGTVAGLVSAVALACIGFYPINNLAPHVTAAMLFFRSGLVTVLLFGIGIQLQRPRRHVVDRRANVAGLAALLDFMVWIELQPGGSADLHGSLSRGRPQVWASALLEWSILVTMVGWFLTVGVCRRHPRAVG
jgi:hypothetical membrane protein